ncbi:MAG: hypothetical protein IH950_00320 [Bacteroidetes bacterium]|nr:hypothetical protein [Bacteroidota bacterium]
MVIKIIIPMLQLILTAMLIQPTVSFAQEEIPDYLQDRGSGIPMSIFGTYVRDGELLVYPFYEYYYDSNMEYEPFDFGLPSMQEFRGQYQANEFLIFLGYGISDRLALEFEAGVITATLTKSENDTSSLESEFTESGISDVEGQIRWRWNHENSSVPEFFNYFEYVFPTGDKHSLIGTSDWEFKLGAGVIKGFNFGTITLRLAFEYDAGEKKVEPGEYALEYLKRISNSFRLFVMLEGSEDEVALVPEIQWFITQSVLLKASTGIGVSSKATDFASEIGIMFSLLP